MSREKPFASVQWPIGFLSFVFSSYSEARKYSLSQRTVSAFRLGTRNPSGALSVVFRFFLERRSTSSSERLKPGPPCMIAASRSIITYGHVLIHFTRSFFSSSDTLFLSNEIMLFSPPCLLHISAAMFEESQFWSQTSWLPITGWNDGIARRNERHSYTSGYPSAISPTE